MKEVPCWRRCEGGVVMKAVSHLQCLQASVWGKIAPAYFIACLHGYPQTGRGCRIGERTKTQ